MRTQFIQVQTLAEAQDAAPWAAVCVEVEGGYMAFESLADLDTWQSQI